MPLSINYRKIHEYQEMIFDFINKGELMITMYDNIDNLLEEATKIYSIRIGSAIAAPSNLYSVRKSQKENELLSDRERK